MTSSNRLSNTSLTWPTYIGHRSNRISLKPTASSLTPVCMGRRVFRDDGATATVYVQSGQQTIADYTASSAPSSPTYRYVYASYIDEPVLRFKPSGSESLYYHRNQQYSVVALTNPSAAIVERYAYSAYGVPTITNASGTLLPVGSVDNRYLYTGREWDQTLSLYHYRARMYDANLGRFASRDPIGYVADLNVYHGFGMKRTDPSGNCGCEVSSPTGYKTGNAELLELNLVDKQTNNRVANWYFGMKLDFSATYKDNGYCYCCNMSQYLVSANDRWAVTHVDGQEVKVKMEVIDNPLKPGDVDFVQGDPRIKSETVKPCGYLVKDFPAINISIIGGNRLRELGASSIEIAVQLNRQYRASITDSCNSGRIVYDSGSVLLKSTFVGRIELGANGQPPKVTPL